MDRRDALKALAAIAVTSSVPDAAAMQTTDTKSGDMIFRVLGRTGEKVSAIGLGGYHLGNPKDPAEATGIIRSAIDRGITFLDNCWDYHDGESERRMGTALRDGYRKRVFLMTKFDGRTKASTAAQIDESLKRLQTDVIDLMQYHENIRMEDGDRFFGGGPLEALLDAKKAGKIRYIGFTGHKDPAVHSRMLDVADAHGFHFDSCQMPLNVLDAHFRSFEHGVLPRLVKDGIGVLGMKPLAEGNVIKSGTVTAIEALHYALNLPTSVVITGCESMARLDQALEAARTFKPMSRADVQALLAKTKSAAMSGEYEPFKTTTMYDGTAHNPQWMG
jgi:aryl-alcohol dehydrogenase-like predicted oxidoreductase